MSLDLDELKRLNSLRTQGEWVSPWDAAEGSTEFFYTAGGRPVVGVCNEGYLTVSRTDAAFIAFMANNAGALIEEIERLRRYRDLVAPQVGNRRKP